MFRNLAMVIVLLFLQACSKDGPVFHATENPLRLSEWKLLTVADNRIAPAAETLVFKPLNTLFTDYAHKLRTMWIPAGAEVELVNGRFEYPVGTVLSKTFYYPLHASDDLLLSQDSGERIELEADQHRLLETRLLVRREAGWEAFPYVWNDEQTEAFLRVAGASLPVSLRGESGTQHFTYFVPNENQCSGCHTRVHPDGGLEPLGAVAHQLNYPLGPALTGTDSEQERGTVLAAMRERGWLRASFVPEPIPAWRDESVSLAERAAAYLDMNCGHCHNPYGAADTSALLLDGYTRTPRQMGLCKPPVAAGGGAGDRLFGIVPGEPEQSILLYRMQSVEPDEMMPELGRSLVHEEGLDLIRAWIEALEGSCG
jgi:uncharacterized repeat protein (TIGR03806 family)